MDNKKATAFNAAASFGAWLDGRLRSELLRCARVARAHSTMVYTAIHMLRHRYEK